MSSDPNALYSRKNPFPAELKTNRKLTGEGSEKDTRHFEIVLAGSGLSYEVGDSLGVFPTNNPALVEEILAALKFTGEELAPNPAGEAVPIRQALLKDYILTEPSKQLLEAVSNKDSSATFLKDLLNPDVKAELDKYTWGRGVIDILTEFDAAFTPEEFVKVLRKLQPRLYSIASSQKAVGEEVHLTVAVVRYESHGRKREGVCSSYLADRVGDDGKVPVFVHTAKHFRVPENPDTDIIMVGPGTGIAPFRAFLQERKVAGAKGRNWLFFGDQRSSTDFLYEEEFKGYAADGILTRFDTAFSRDQEYKIYVQHRMAEHAAELYAWLEGGAYFYVCGDANRMAKDVDVALHQAIQTAGGKTEEEAKEYVAKLKTEKRYRRDVY